MNRNDAPPGYVRTLERMIAAGERWLKRFPGCDLTFRVPRKSNMLIGSLDDRGRWLLGVDATTQEFLLFVAESVDHDADIFLAVLMIEFLPAERVTIRELGKELERLRNRQLN